MASQFRHRKAKITTRSNVESVRLRVFISGTTQFATVETNTRSTAMTASSTLMSLPSKVRAVAFSKPSNWTTCCCCCWSSILEMRVWQASSASYRKRERIMLLVKPPCPNLWQNNTPEVIYFKWRLVWELHGVTIIRVRSFGSDLSFHCGEIFEFLWCILIKTKTSQCYFLSNLQLRIIMLGVNMS